MKSIFLSIAGMAISTLSTYGQANTDDAQIRGHVATMEEGWTKKDGELFARPFAENADYVVINGTHVKGRKAIADGHQFIFSSFYRETFIKTDIQSIRYLRPDIAIVHMKSHMTGVSNGEKVDTNGYITLTFEKTANGWQVAAFQNTGVQPPRPVSNQKSNN